MAGNIIHITFNEDLPIGANLSLSGVYTASGLGSSTPLNPNWVWAQTRNSPYTVSTGTPTALPGERSAIDFMQAFQLDYAVNGQHTITRNGKVITIVSLYGMASGYLWDNGIAFLPNPGGVPSLADVIFEFTFQNNASPFVIEEIQYTVNPANRCDSVFVTISTSTNIKSITQPVQNANVQSDTYSFVFTRGTAANIVVTDTSTQPLTITQGFQTPPLLAPDNFNISVNGSPNGGTIVITSENQEGLTLTYAISPPNTSPMPSAYQSSNVFGGIAPGTYWLSIKDQFGCIKTKTFVVAEVTAGPPFFYLSKAMSIRFANRIVWGDAGNYKTDENTLSCETDVKLPYKEIQQFQTADIITTQFKSNYSINRATIIKEDGTRIDVPVLQKTNNIGVKDRRDAFKVNLNNGKTGIYFQSGNVYDYDTGVTTGTYALNGSLPYWGTPGNYIRVDDIWYQIEETIFDETLSVDIIVIGATYTGNPIETIVSSIYNLFNYEVYEFTIDFVNYQNQRLQVEIYCDDVEYGDIMLLSEVIHVMVRHRGTIEIKYRNSENTDVFYSTGISNLIRIPVNKVNAVPDETSEAYKTDNTAVLLSSEVYEQTKFIFEPVTKEIMRKMVQAFNHDTLQMDGVYYVKNAACEVEGPLEETNIYVVSANLIKTAGAFNSSLSGSGNEIFDTTNTEIPGLIDIGDGNYVRY